MDKIMNESVVLFLIIYIISYFISLVVFYYYNRADIHENDKSKVSLIFALAASIFSYIVIPIFIWSIISSFIYKLLYKPLGWFKNVYNIINDKYMNRGINES